MANYSLASLGRHESRTTWLRLQSIHRERFVLVQTLTMLIVLLADVDMDADETAQPVEKSNKALKREKTSKAAKIEKKRIRKPRNRIAFAKHPKKAGGKKR